MIRWVQAVLVALLLCFTGSPVHVQAQAVDAPKVEEQKPLQKIDPRKLLVPRKNADGTIKIASFTESPVR